MHPIYFSHGYRERETRFVAYFGSLMNQSGFLPSLDPPSDDVNAAKLERHLGYTTGMIAILTSREEGVSQHILYEISMCLRSGKPVLVFIEDNLPEKIVPNTVLRRRFSATSYFRETTEHMHALKTFKAYIGEKPVPKYQPTTTQRSCLLVGIESLGKDINYSITNYLETRGYKSWRITERDYNLFNNGELHFKIALSKLAICLVDNRSKTSAYVLGAVQASLVPTIPLTEREDAPLRENVPEEYQRRVLPPGSVDEKLKVIDSQVKLFEEDFLDLDFEGKAEEYSILLAQAASPTGSYSKEIRTMIFQEVTMGDKYVQNQGIQGRNVNVGSATFSQIWKETQPTVDIKKLALELSALHNKLEKTLDDPVKGPEVNAVVNAEKEAKKGNGPKVLFWLAKTGEWTLDTAKKIAANVVVEVIKKSWMGI